MLNRLSIIKNPYQGEHKKVLAVCSAGLLRSPSIAWTLSQKPFDFNTRAAGIDSFALIPVDKVLIEWADEIVCADFEHVERIHNMVKESTNPNKPVYCFEIPDIYSYRNPKLIKIIKEKAAKIWVI